MEWIRGDTIGRGSFGTVNFAIPLSKSNLSHNSSPLVVKSSDIPNSNSLKNEKQILSELGNNHPHIIQLLGDSFSLENGTHFYNLFLEYATKGSLSDQLRISGGKFEFSDVKKYTKSILEGLCFIHDNNFVHCDIKLQNILLFSSGMAKIADFGLAKRVSDSKTGFQLRGTPLYMSPEIVAGGEVESPADIWALGCAVVEMVSGMPAWNCSPECDVSGLLYRIGVAGESPLVPENMCCEGKDFLNKCFLKDPNERWTARMLLDHPFLSGLEDPCCKIGYVSPRCPFDFPDWESSSCSSSNSISNTVGSFDWESSSYSSLNSNSRLNTVGSFDWEVFSGVSEVSGRSSMLSRFEEQVVGDRVVVPEWTNTDTWVSVR